MIYYVKEMYPEEQRTSLQKEILALQNEAARENARNGRLLYERLVPILEKYARQLRTGRSFP